MDLTINHLSLILALSGLIIASISAVIGTLAFIEVQRSTHSIQYMPVDDAIDKENEAFLKTVKTDDSWATSPDTLKKQDELYKEELESEMPSFASTDEDMEIISY